MTRRNWALMRVVIGAAVLVVSAAFGATLYVQAPASTSVTVELYCPQEDSCVPDYRNGQWHITQVTP